jgi:hypothetical protein
MEIRSLFETGFTKGPCIATMLLYSGSAICVLFAQNMFYFICSVCTWTLSDIVL